VSAADQLYFCRAHRPGIVVGWPIGLGPECPFCEALAEAGRLARALRARSERIELTPAGLEALEATRQRRAGR